MHTRGVVSMAVLLSLVAVALATTTAVEAALHARGQSVSSGPTVQPPRHQASALVRAWMSANPEATSEPVPWRSCVADPDSEAASVAQAGPSPDAELPTLLPLSSYHCETAILAVPLSWEAPDDYPTIDVHMQRWFASNSSSAPLQQLFMLEGGPGSSDMDIQLLVPQLLALMKNISTIYLPDHRGTGLSTPLTCPASEHGTWEQCMQYVSNHAPAQLGVAYMQQFSVSNAAHDVSYMIERVRADDFKREQALKQQASELQHGKHAQPSHRARHVHASLSSLHASTTASSSPAESMQTFVYGMSYGTFLANRFMVVAPGQTDGVVLDGITPPDITDLTQYDVQSNQAALEILSLCQADPACNTHFPDQRVLGLLFDLRLDLHTGDLVQRNVCAKQMGLTSRRLALYMFLLLSQTNSRMMAGPFLVRLRRCSDAHGDLAALMTFIGLQADLKPLEEYAGPTPFLTSSLEFPVLMAQVVSSELLGSHSAEEPGPLPLPLQERQAVLNATAVGAGTSALSTRIWSVWTAGGATYARDQWAGLYPSRWSLNDAPLLMFNGDLDLSTSLADAHHYARQIGASMDPWPTVSNTRSGTDNSTRARLIKVPFAAHISAVQSPLLSDVRFTCGQMLLSSFVVSGGSLDDQLDTSCLKKVRGHDWNAKLQVTQQASQQFFNTTNLWGDL